MYRINVIDIVVNVLFSVHIEEVRPRDADVALCCGQLDGGRFTLKVKPVCSVAEADDAGVGRRSDFIVPLQPEADTVGFAQRLGALKQLKRILDCSVDFPVFVLIDRVCEITPTVSRSTGGAVAHNNDGLLAVFRINILVDSRGVEADAAVGHLVKVVVLPYLEAGELDAVLIRLEHRLERAYRVFQLVRHGVNLLLSGSRDILEHGIRFEIDVLRDGVALFCISFRIKSFETRAHLLELVGVDTGIRVGAEVADVELIARLNVSIAYLKCVGSRQDLLRNLAVDVLRQILAVVIGRPPVGTLEIGFEIEVNVAVFVGFLQVGGKHEASGISRHIGRTVFALLIVRALCRNGE